ncbi:MAG: RNA methyltransferase [Betaproteobacteria bacterium]|nr:MAG: RNA methyltransferase [Betaproteobacteria bacterium]
MTDFNGPSLARSPLNEVVVVLSHTSHPGNIGAVARAMKTMGLSDLRLVNPDTFPSEIASARASGANDVLEQARVFSALTDAIADCVYVVGSSARGRDFVGETKDVRSACAEAIAQSANGKVAIVFGCEMSGMTNAEVALCQTLAYIPANAAYSSLNLGSAVQVFAYELRMAAGLTAGYPASQFQPATQEEIERLFVHMQHALTVSGFFNPENPKRLFPRLRRLFARTRLEREEVDIFRGIFRTLEARSPPAEPNTPSDLHKKR